MSWLRRLWRWLVEALFGVSIISVPTKVKVRKQ
jgi:hypothetical protein